MATFVVLGKWTDRSFEAMKDPKACEEIKKIVKDMGADIKAWYMLMGQYDEVCILEAPDAEIVARIVIALTMKYGGKSETLRAFSEEEAKKICPSQG
ncbi:MAG: GYD domain-containing protein [Deltaproteobacteria bacterium]|nr:MAG: GYD domain-containing protein [Deltaproteobacteria bacterium]